MTPERDTDRQLRAWVSKGADRAPERAVWAAIDEIERVPQRPAWRSRLGDLGLRLRPVRGLVSVLGAAAVLLVALVVGLRLLDPVPGPGAAPRALTLDDLPAIVLWADTKPPAWTLDNLISNPTEVRRAPIRSLTESELEALPAPDGYLGGRYTDFSTPDAVFISWATVYEREVDAAVAMAFYVDELESTAAWGLGPGSPLQLGDGGSVHEGLTRRLTGNEPGEPVASRMYLWRHGNVLLALGGWFEFDRAQLDAIAAAIDERVRTLAGTGGTVR